VKENMATRRPFDECSPLEVRVEGENLQRAITQLKKKMATEGVFKELKRRRFHEKPSERRKRKMREAARRRRKALRARTRRR
jgi:small subunit ribosomal protein S21